MGKGMESAPSLRVNCFGNVKFLNIEMASPDSPFAVVEYAIKGRKQAYGLRFDLDKQVFLDKTGDHRWDRELLSRAGEVVRAVEVLPPKPVVGAGRQVKFTIPLKVTAGRLLNSRRKKSSAISRIKKTTKIVRFK